VCVYCSTTKFSSRHHVTCKQQERAEARKSLRESPCSQGVSGSLVVGNRRPPRMRPWLHGLSLKILRASARPGSAEFENWTGCRVYSMYTRVLNFTIDDFRMFSVLPVVPSFFSFSTYR